MSTRTLCRCEKELSKTRKDQKKKEKVRAAPGRETSRPRSQSRNSGAGGKPKCYAYSHGKCPGGCNRAREPLTAEEKKKRDEFEQRIYKQNGKLPYAVLVSHKFHKPRKDRPRSASGSTNRTDRSKSRSLSRSSAISKRTHSSTRSRSGSRPRSNASSGRQRKK